MVKALRTDRPPDAMRQTGSEQELGQDELVAGLQALGLQQGDSVVVHSSLSSLGWVRGGAATVIESLLAVVGNAGHIMMPYFFPPLYPGVFDYAHPPVPYTGAVPRALRTWPGAILSIHPTHPFVVVGPAAQQLTEGHYLTSSVGRDSPIDRLAKLGGKVLLLGVGQEANTLIHTGEAYAAVPYWGQLRPDRPPGRRCRLPDNQEIWVPLPETPGDGYGFGKIEPWLRQQGLMRLDCIGAATCSLIPGQRLIETVIEFLENEPGGLLCDRPDCTFCLWARQFLVVPE